VTEPPGPLLVGRTYVLGHSPAITRTQIARYAGASGDFLPIHVDEEFARSRGYESVMVHGMWTMGYAGQLVATWVGGDRIRRFGGRFRAPVWPGDELTVTATVAERDDTTHPPRVEIELAVSNQDGIDVFAGYASVLARE
jgi:peroxisomal enoyl-CoA hydratase 2